MSSLEHPIEEHNKQFGSLFVKIENHECKLNDHAVMFENINGKLNHIQSRLDEGIGPSMREIATAMKEFIKANADNAFAVNSLAQEVRPQLKDHDYWIVKIKQGVIWVGIFTLSGVLVSLAVNLIKLKFG